MNDTRWFYYFFGIFKAVWTVKTFSSETKISSILWYFSATAFISFNPKPWLSFSSFVEIYCPFLSFFGSSINEFSHFTARKPFRSSALNRIKLFSVQREAGSIALSNCNSAHERKKPPAAAARRYIRSRAATGKRKIPTRWYLYDIGRHKEPSDGIRWPNRPPTARMHSGRLKRTGHRNIQRRSQIGAAADRMTAAHLRP